MKISEIKKAVFINLNRRKDRLKSFKEKWAEAGEPLKIKRFPARDGSVIPKPSWFWPPEGAWGCYLSHLEAIMEAIEEGGVKNLLVLEDDAVFREGFKDNFAECLNELPEDWDMFYLGGQHLKTEECPPVKISDHLAKGYFINLTTGYLLNEKAFKTVVDHLLDFMRFRYISDGLSSSQHVDRQFGELCRDQKLNVYAADPWLCGQDSGTSDVGCYDARPAKVFFDTKSEEKNFPVGDGVSVRHFSCSYGTIGLGGDSGYENKRTAPPFPGDTLSIHPDSNAVVVIEKPKYLYGFIDGNHASHDEISLAAGRFSLGKIKNPGDWTEPLLLTPGVWTLSMKTAGCIYDAHAVWCFRDAPFCPIPEGAWIEILVTGICPRHCPECNQAEWMKSAVSEKYSYSEKDALALTETLGKYGAKVRILFSGGEPRYWKEMEEVIGTFRRSENVLEIRATTSQDDEEFIKKISELTDRIYFTRRPDMEWPNGRPEYLAKAIVWEQMTHSVWPSEPWHGEIECCCLENGVRCSVVGQTVQACTVAENMRLMGRWSEGGPVSLDDYFSGRKAFRKMGNYDACRMCVNNRKWREQSEQRKC